MARLKKSMCAHSRPISQHAMPLLATGRLQRSGWVRVCETKEACSVEPQKAKTRDREGGSEEGKAKGEKED